METATEAPAVVPTTTEEKIAAAGAIADAVLNPGTAPSAAEVQTAAAVDVAGAIAKVLMPKYSGEIALAASLEPVAFHAGQALAHLFQHWFHHTKSVPIA
jgi:hypothetical protein